MQTPIRQVKVDNAVTKPVMGTGMAKLAQQPQSMNEVDFKIVSQFGDANISQYLIGRIKPRVIVHEKFREN